MGRSDDVFVGQGAVAGLKSVSVSPLSIVTAHPWQRVAFTTYALSLSFFEAVILDGLVRAGSRAQSLVLSDVHGVRESLSERGAHRVGRDYEVEPVVVTDGVFHPKIAVLASAEECHVLVGSGNLTFNGWGGNCEVIEHLHPSFAAGAIAGVAEFFERLAESTRVRFGANRECVQIAADLRRAIQGRRVRGDIRFVHNLDVSLTDQIAEAVEDLGGAKRLAAAAPFWDGGSALDSLCGALGLKEAHVHAHAGGCVEGTIVSNWPRKASTAVHAVRIGIFDKASESARRLHAKAFEIVCRRGRLLVAGSANGTGNALAADGNIEACIMRVERRPSSGWKITQSTAPEPLLSPRETEPDDAKRIGVLRAVLDGDQLTGEVMVPRMSGVVKISMTGSLGLEPLSEVTIGARGEFTLDAPDLEKGSWRGGRLVLRVTDRSGRIAEGFVSLAGYAEVARHGGTVTRRLLALILGTETPADVAAILDWFLEDPHRLLPAKDAAHGHDDAPAKVESDQLIPVAALDVEFVDAIAAAKSGEAGGRHWSRFLDQVLSAFRTTRGRFELSRELNTEDDEEDVEPRDLAKAKEEDAAIENAYDSFNQLFEILTGDDAPPRHVEVGFDLTSFICARLNPEMPRAHAWLTTVVRAWLVAGVRPERREDVAAAIMILLGTSPDAAQARWARKSLLMLGNDLSALPAPGDSVRNCLTVLRQQEPLEDLWRRVQEVRTYQEQVDAYVRALEAGVAAPAEYPDLPRVAADAWPAMARALNTPGATSTLLYVNGTAESCPVHHMSLPTHEIDRLRTTGIAMARNCCGKVLIQRVT